MSSDYRHWCHRSWILVGILFVVPFSISGCELLGLSNKLDVKITVFNQAGGYIESAWVSLGEMPWDTELGVEVPGQTSGRGMKLTDEDGVAFFEDRRKGNFRVIIETAGYQPHWEVFPARTGPVFQKSVTLLSR